jgi:hypothetical protein
LDLLGLDKQIVDEFPKQGYTPEQVKDTRQTPKETINSGPGDSSVATPPIDRIVPISIVKKRKRERKENNATQSQEESTSRRERG